MRVFVAIDLDDSVRDAVARLVGRLRAGGIDLAYVAGPSLHLTLKFLGEVDDREVVAASDALSAMSAACPPFEIGFGSLGAFPPRGAPRVLWIGVNDPGGGLDRCSSLCEREMASRGFPSEGRPFSPHLTIARSRRAKDAAAIRRAVQEQAGFAAGAQWVESVTLYQSTLTPRGAIHEPLGRFELKGSADDVT